MMGSQNFTFNLSLSVLNHLGRNLYRSFMTVLGEAISNSWDADATQVDIFIDRNQNTLVVKDNGLGMTSDDFQYKFLKIGYSKRKDGITQTDKGRPFIGKKGIGKLALLSCAEQITIISKTESTDYVGGVINNQQLDEAIIDDVSVNNYELGVPTLDLFEPHTIGHDKGTIIFFENVHEGIRNRLEYIRQLIALHFRFSLIDPDFSIYLNGEKITNDDIKDFADKTEFLWIINETIDDFALEYIPQGEKFRFQKTEQSDYQISGFIASVEKPSQLKLRTTEVKIGVDLFVNGRLRETQILKHIPTTRVVESYLYGQIHYDELDSDDEDRFTSSREGIVADDPKFLEFTEELKTILSKVLNQWDKWRREIKESGDPDNTEELTPSERKSEELYNLMSEDFIPPKESPNEEKVNQWISDLGEEAKFNIPSYTDCFIAENLIRKFITDQEISLSTEAKNMIKDYKDREVKSKGLANISFEIRKDIQGIMYLDMKPLAALVDKCNATEGPCLYLDSIPYKPIRDAIAHTSIVTDDSKRLLRVILSNIRARVVTLLTTRKTEE